MSQSGYVNLFYGLRITKDMMSEPYLCPAHCDYCGDAHPGCAYCPDCGAKTKDKRSVLIMEEDFTSVEDPTKRCEVVCLENEVPPWAYGENGKSGAVFIAVKIKGTIDVECFCAKGDERNEQDVSRFLNHLPTDANERIKGFCKTFNIKYVGIPTWWMVGGYC